MLKKILSLLMAVVLVTASTTTIVKAQEVNTNRASQVITALGIMKTDDEKTTKNKTEVTRAQFAQMLVNMSSYKNMVGNDTNITLFKDVSKKHWAASYIKVAISEQWMSGYLNGKFMPSQAITLQESVNAIVKLLGYTNSDFSGNKNAAKMSLYYSKDLDKNISKTKGQKITKTDCMNLLYNTLVATNKGGVVYGTTLGYALDANGDIDYLNLVNKKMKGPIIADDNWATSFPIPVDSATYYRNSAISNKGSIQKYDVLYYSETLKTIWAYSEKVLGTVEKISPDRLNPTEITIAGNKYKIGTQEMSYQFSTLGTVNEGDVVTALIGKDGSVVGVLTEEQYNASINGVVIKSGKKLSDVVKDSADLNNYVVIVDAYGREHTYEFDAIMENYQEKAFPEGGVVNAVYKDGKVSVAETFQRFLDPISGKVDATGSKMGQFTIAKDVKILDVNGSQYSKIYTSRIAGTEIHTSDILYYAFNSNGDIQELILKNYTGDLDSYGILMEFSGDPVTQTYVIKNIVNGEEKTSTSTSADLNMQISTGPVGFSYADNQIDKITKLYGFGVSSISGRNIKGWDDHLLADQVAVYYVKKSKYYQTKLANVSDLTKYNLTAYYDKSTLQGGRVRVILAQDK